MDRLEPRDMPLSSRQTGTDSTGWKTFDPSYRRSDSGKSLHYNGEGAFHDHREGEAFGVLSLYASEQGIITEPWNQLADSDWWDAVDAARDAGAPIPEFTTQDAELVSTLPLDRLDALDSEERERYARTNGFDWPNTSKVRDLKTLEAMDTASITVNKTTAEVTGSIGGEGTIVLGES